mgnify:CR=1 FL=1
MTVWRRSARPRAPPWPVSANWPRPPTDGALGAKHKELVALAIAVTQRCSGCIGFHVKALVQLGCTRAELEEMLSVCVYMGGGPALMYAAEAMAAWDKMAPAEQV